MGIMTCNNELLSELELVTTELALSIKRELALETKLRGGNATTQDPSLAQLQKELLSNRKLIAELQEKLSKERRLRFISEEHALLSEHGQSPSPLKLNYENTELYKQLLIKNDEVKQLEDKIVEYEKGQKSDTDLLDKYNELLAENTDLKFHVIPNLQRQIEQRDDGNSSRVFNITGDQSFELSDEDELSTLRNQRDELRSTVNRLTRNNDVELRSAQEKIRSLEVQLRDMKRINDKLSIREDTKPATNGFIKNGGGKLSGLAIISPTQNLFD
ncbi:uncharacterized protein SPAPADRAFT_60373 [Spathaspora passalidarum NRRL Y-27907]|uniref:Uncharacterized protein n=1 Tax=Spathaspora passalidarum (strain NRRL Y-27907 / 11-Y1) TaxID=619300 RepID=G3AL13_SPAPN|nr:uncharacterized protein SPAPADRAFT_60373 [Spathaspora passalidarum NRRL Y-27907]EGW33055.1 hypothetical protein SPAPADRAFT_60373 [Spathaspora passalidarum NRRL Y-27907]